MADCGLDVGEPDPEASAEAQAALDDVLGEVEVVGAALPRFVDGAPDEAVGLPAPVIVGADYAGAPVTIDAATNGPTMVLVVAHWCPYCNEELPKLNQLRDDGRIPDGVNVVAVSTGVDPSRSNFPPDEWLVDMDWTFPAVADGLDDAGLFEASGALGTAAFPFVTLIDGDGNVTERWAGARDIEVLAAALEELAPS
jgi:thiol-disulfide isomerase/thioredoxin